MSSYSRFISVGKLEVPASPTSSTLLNLDSPSDLFSEIGIVVPIGLGLGGKVSGNQLLSSLISEESKDGTGVLTVGSIGLRLEKFGLAIIRINLI